MSKSFIINLGTELTRLRVAAENGDFVAAMDAYFLLGRPVGPGIPSWLIKILPQSDIFPLGQKPAEESPTAELVDESEVDWHLELSDEVAMENWEPPESPSDFHFSNKGKHASCRAKLKDALVDLTRHKAVREVSEQLGVTGEARFEQAHELLVGQFGQGSAGACKHSYYKAKKLYGPEGKSPFVCEYKSREMRDWLEETGMIPIMVGLIGV